MPFPRPTLTDLQTNIAYYSNSNLTGADALLRFSNVGVIGKALANLVNLQYGYLDYVALNAVPFTAVDESLIGWAALKGVFQKGATSAMGVVKFPASGTNPVPPGTALQRSDGVGATSTANAIPGGGFVYVSAKINADPTGLTGAFGNCDVGTQFTLGASISGISSSGVVSTEFTGGSDLESQDDLRTRMLAAYQSIPGTGTRANYIEWALAVAGVTRAWCKPNVMGSGTVGVYTMFDQAEAAFGGFPQGTNGCATLETRDVTATGDQLAVANYVYTLQPATALVYSNAPINSVTAFVISGISGVSSAVKAAILAALQDLFMRQATADGTSASPTPGSYAGILVSDMEGAIGSVGGSTGFILTSPAVNLPNVVGYLLTVNPVISFT